MVTVAVFSKSSGNPKSHIRVAISWSGFLSGMSKEETDDKGEAHFDHEPAEGTLYVDGKTIYEKHLSGKIIVYI